MADGSSVRATDVTNLATVWSYPNPDFHPIAPLLDERFAMYDAVAGTLTELAADGAPLQTVPFSPGYQSAFGQFTQIEGAGSASMLTSRVSLPLDEDTDFFRSGGGSGSQQNSPQVPAGRTTNEEETAFMLMDRLVLVAPQFVDNKRIEHAGQICRERNGQYYYYQYLSKGNTWSAPSLNTDACKSSTTVGYAHSHPATYFLSDMPSGFSSHERYLDGRPDIDDIQPSDLKIADDVFDGKYDAGPTSIAQNLMWYVTAPGAPPNGVVYSAQSYAKYKKTSTSPAKDNIFQFDPTLREWVGRPAPWSF
jgi:hypothetical protein